MPLPKNLPEFAREHFEAQPEFLSALERLEQRRGIRLLYNAWSDPSEINFYARLAEMRFGLFFDPHVEQLWYERLLDNKRPDWTIKARDQQCIAEVLRVNAEEKEMLAYFEETRIIRRFQKANPGVPIIPPPRSKILSSAYFYNAQAKLEAKEEKYGTLVVQYKLPLIICIAPFVLTFISDQDTFDFLIGSRKEGYFYQSDVCQENIAGVLLETYFGSTFFFENPNARFPLSSHNLSWMRSATTPFKPII
jgi:hypothetical protein